MMSNLQVYDVLKKHMAEEAARVIAESLPLSEQLATKTDVFALRGDFEGLRAEFTGLRAEFTGLRAEFTGLRSDFRAELHRMEAAIYRWMLTFFATLWLGMAGMIVAILITR